MRKAYTKPGLTRVDLVPSEAVLTGCKDNIFQSAAPDGSPTACWWSTGGGSFAGSCKLGGS